jgi:HEAT repeat protein
VGERKPNIKSLVRREDVEGLLEAASYQQLAPTSAGAVNDFGIPVRMDALLALGTLAPERGHEVITVGLRDPADRVRCAAVRVLHALNDVNALADALRWLPRDQGHSRKLALEAIFDLRSSVSPSAVADALVHRQDDDLLGEEDAQLILALLEGKRADETDGVLELLILALDDKRGIVVDRASEMLVRLAPESIGALVAELRTGANPADAAYVMGRIGDPKTLDVLVKALRHRNARVRAESAAALAELEDPAAVKPLLQASHDREHSVRSQARIALDRMGNIAVIEGVAELLRPVVREAVRSAIPHPQVEADGGNPEPRSRARRRSRSPRSTGVPPRSNGGPPEAADPPLTDQQRME